MSLFLLQMMQENDFVFSIKTILNVLTLGLCITACYTDLSKGRVPNWLTMPFLLFGFALQYVAGGWADGNVLSLSESVGGLLVGGGFMLLLYFIGGLGGGDVKLFAAIGALKGQAFTLQAVLNACLVGGTLALFQIIFRWITYTPYTEQKKIEEAPKVQIVPESEALTIEQKKEWTRKKREEEEKKKAEQPSGSSLGDSSLSAENSPVPQPKPLHPEDPEAEISSSLSPKTASTSDSEKKPGEVFMEEEEKKQGIPFGFAISLGVIITFILTPKL